MFVTENNNTSVLGVNFLQNSCWYRATLENIRFSSSLADEKTKFTVHLRNQTVWTKLTSHETALKSINVIGPLA